VSAANVSQLAVDLLIASLSLRPIGLFDSRDLVPVVGGREDGEGGVSTPLERELRFLLVDCSD
jgi:proteasome assembly chaperone 2